MGRHAASERISSDQLDRLLGQYSAAAPDTGRRPAGGRRRRVGDGNEDLEALLADSPTYVRAGCRRAPDGDGSVDQPAKHAL